MFKRVWLAALAILLIAAMAVVGCGPKDEIDVTDPGVEPSTDPVFGGTLKVVIDAEPPTIDMHASTTTLVYNVGWHIFEQLYTLDEEFDIIPMLAAGMPEISEDKLTYTIKLREGVSFHNGKEMTSADVVASLERWGEVAGNGQVLFAKIASLEADGPYQVKLTLNEPIGTVLVYLAIPNGGAAIYPEEIVAGAGAEPLEQFIGTGPYEFVEWEPNQYIKLKKYDGYEQVDFDATGYGGAKTAYVDELDFYFFADASVRIASVESGDYHFADFVPVDEYDRLKDTPGLEAIASQPRGWFTVVFNKKEGVMSNKLIRQAFLAALDMDPIMEAGYGHRDFWRLDPSIMFKEQVWWSDAGAELYNQDDPDRAEALLEEAGYDGEPIRWMTGPLEYNFSLAAKNQLEKVGFNIELEQMDWATVTDRRSNPELWEAFSTGMTFRADPTMMVVITPTYAGWWENDDLVELLAEMAVEEDFAFRYALWEQVQELFYEEVPTVKIGDYSNLRLLREDVRGFANMNEIFFWNVWLAP
ncbi:MAG: ABC transporter substrate-binding protein [Firmicutes bacterium]|nr:ABC transporter substrate-binding protein [Bacillota bacterium]